MSYSYQAKMINTFHITYSYIKVLQARGIDLDRLCNVFNSDIYVRTKRNYLYVLPQLNNKEKDHLWELFIGDLKQ